MEYNYFKQLMKQGSKLVATGSNHREIIRFFLSHGIDVTNYMVKDFMKQSQK